jgi:tRNA(adenine34) deaminase
VVCNNQIIAKGHNLTEKLNDVTAHAEMIAITSAANYLGSKYLNECTIYISLEPCIMCAGAIFWAQFEKVVFAASDEKRGFEKAMVKLHPKTKIEKGILEEEASLLLKEFFKNLR